MARRNRRSGQKEFGRRENFGHNAFITHSDQSLDTDAHKPCRVFRVLVVDDDEDDHLLFQRWVRRAVAAPLVKLVSSGVAAISYLESLAAHSPELPHVIFCDIKMPGIDGFDFLQWLRQSKHRHIPVVMRSSSTISSDIARAYQLGANSYVVKRMEIQSMEERINDLVHYWRDIAEVPG
jgi:CheY-like chemotaxis protein